MRIPKKFVSVAVAASFFFGLLAHPRSAHATAQGVETLYGIVVIGASVGAAATETTLTLKNVDNVFVDTIVVIASVALGIAGIMWGDVLLDDSSSARIPQYAPLTSAQAQQLGVSAGEERIYESELPQINAIAQTIAAQITQSGDAPQGAQSLELAASAWKTYETALSPDSVSVIQKIGANLTAQVNGRLAETH